MDHTKIGHYVKVGNSVHEIMDCDRHTVTLINGDMAHVYGMETWEHMTEQGEVRVIDAYTVIPHNGTYHVVAMVAGEQVGIVFSSPNGGEAYQLTADLYAMMMR